MNAIAKLDEEHDRILEALTALEHVAYAPADAGPFRGDDAARLVEFFRRFVEGAHHGKEEEALFPALARTGISEEQGPLASVRAQHEEARALLRDLTEALDAASRGLRARFTRAAEAYITVLRNVIRKERYVLYHAARRRLGEEAQSALLGEFARIDARAACAG